MTPIEILKDEHKLILLVLDAVEREADSIRNTGKIDVEKIEKMVDFFKNFADLCHHSKEEKCLFAKLQEKGFSWDKGPIPVMLKEHDEGRRRVKALAEALPLAKQGDSLAISSVEENLSAYVELLRAHISKEDEILYPMADRVFLPKDQQELAEAFEKVEAEEMGEGVHEKYHQLALDLAKS